MGEESKKLVILSTGGTGGHIMPARALGIDLLARGFRVEVITDSRGEKYRDLFPGMPMHVIKAGMMGRGLTGKLLGVVNILMGVVQAALMIGKMKPAVVVGFGGYPSFPAVYAAQKSGIPTILHEQNAVIGKANAMLAPRAKRIALSLPVLAGLDESDKGRSVITGNPVRPEIVSLYTEAYPALKNGSPLNIFVMGGSLGATVFSDIVPKTLARLPDAEKKRLHITQQCRAADIDAVRAAYEQAGIKAELATFFDDVAGHLRNAHLVIARSGASTVAEVTTAGRPAIFVPYPHHKDQQQKMNADAVADAGGAWMMTESGFTEEALLARIETFLQNPQILFKAAEAARSCGCPDAALKLGNLVTAVASGWDE